MKVECVVHANDSPEVIKDRLIRYYTGIGYRLERDNADVLVFRRGSVIKGMVSFSPKAWKAVVEAKVARSTNGQIDALINYDVNTAGQTITQGEIDFWDAEVAALDEAVTAGIFRSEDSHVAERERPFGATGASSVKRCSLCPLRYLR